MAEFGIDAYGVDISPKAIELSNQMANYFNKKANFSVFDGKHLEFDDEFFDFSACLGGVLNCVAENEIQNIVNELERVTKTYICVGYITKKIDIKGNIPDIGILNLGLDIEKLFKKFKLFYKASGQSLDGELITEAQFLVFKNPLEK